MEHKDVTEFYDNYIEAQKSSGVNERIFGLYTRIKKCGLNTHSNVLELGCGIGVFTFLLSRIIKKGSIEAVDISNKSIAFCKQKIKNSNIQFVAGDIVNYSPVFGKPDFITLLDVIEHIPVEKHPGLFNNLSALCMDDTKLIINIPNPSYIEYDIKNHPDNLQLIDQPLPLNFILDNLIKNNLELIYFETYSVWVENDYQFLVATRKKEFKEILLSNKRNFFQKVKMKLKRILIRIRYKYP